MGSRNIARHAATSSVQAPADRTFKETVWILEKVQRYTTGSTWHVLFGHRPICGGPGDGDYLAQNAP